MREVLILKTTESNEKKAKKIAKLLIENKLAACVSIKYIDSIYRWKDNIEETKEIETTATAAAKQAIEELKLLHANDAIITKDGITTFDKGDILVAAQEGNVKLGEDLDASIASRTETLNKSIVENTNTTTNTTALRPLSLKLEGNIDVNNGEGRMNAQDFLKLLQMDRGVALETGKLLNDAISLGA